ncbi:DDE superfamily endonuclease [Phytophthora infestans]|uniref:DDE superfamily endonuclease n=1 Tax=Phytophthora infestans TaxID=4787 RepID=A0A833WKS3_PHYIN|nr:DDE superfamily endonuclease [Phytophthora infestans]KAF4127405.1 DDE superfamily endonuclease [Phytophthora infestans]
MVGKGRGKRLTDSERMEIIARLEDPSSQLSKAECARQHGVTPAAISKLMKVSQSVKKRYSDAGADSSGFRDKRQRGGFSKNVPFEDELFRWICSVRARKVPLLVSHVQSKAKLLATRHKMKEDFKASNGWYYRFCNRYGLSPASLHTGNSTSPGDETQQSSTGEMKKEGAETTREWTNLRDKIKQFGPEFVYTLSEARLFYQMLPRALDVVPEHLGTSQETTGMIADAVERNGAPGKAARVLVLVCVNATGTHKIPLLVVGKEKVPACLAALHPQLLRGGVNSAAGIGASYHSQRDIWCSDRTFQHWCGRVFLPAVRQRTTQPVLLITENPGGRLAGFQQENVSTVFLPLRTSSGGCEVNLSSQQHAHLAKGNAFQPPHATVVRDFKRRYKIGLFQERLNFIETPNDEKYRLIQRAAKKPVGTAGVALGRVPNLLDAMSLLNEAWAAIPPSLIRSGWIKSNLGNTSIISPDSLITREQNDDAVVMECCSMLRNLNLVDDMNKLAKDIRLWLCVDDDSSEQMQQELLYDIQQLLQEEEQEQQSSNQCLQQQVPSFQQQNAAAFMDATSLSTGFDPSQSGSYVYRTAAPVLTMDPNVVQAEKRKAIELALRALAGAEEALDNADVAEFYGDEAAGQAMESISRALRRLRRIQRGKQSALVAAAVNAAANGDANDSTGGALSTHEYFYGNGALGRNA